MPDAPTVIPAQDFTGTSATQIKIDYTAFTSSNNGGSAILGYDLWRDSGSGTYVQLYESDQVLATSYIDTDVEKGSSYKYKYRARNINGYGELSDESYMTAASVPSQPDAPTLTSVDSTTIVLKFYAPEDTGGIEVSSYELERDSGSLNTAFSSVGTYDQTSLTHSMTVSADSLTAGKIYTFRFRAVNDVGNSEYSEYLRVGLGNQVGQPQNLAADLSATGPNYITLEWDPVADADLDTLGYIVQMLVGTAYETVYDASNDPDATSYTKYGLTAGEEYTFIVYAVNFNGFSDASDSVTVYACGLPEN